MSAKHTTAASGIGSMLCKAEIDDFVFEPCGYSMNGCDGEGFSTIHVTPEEGFSYASLELSGYPAKGVDPTAIVTKVRLPQTDSSSSISHVYSKKKFLSLSWQEGMFNVMSCVRISHMEYVRLCFAFSSQLISALENRWQWF